MRKRALCTALLFCIAGMSLWAANTAPAQLGQVAPAINESKTIDLARSMQALTDWKFHPGDDPAYAQPDYDDSGWVSMDMRGDGNSHDPYFSSEVYVPGWTARGFPTLSGYAWYRTRFQLTGNNTDLWLEMPPNFDDGCQIYVNGKLIGVIGNFTPGHLRMYFSRSAMFHLPPLSPGSEVVLALRFYMDPDTPAWNVLAGGLHSAPVIGLASTIALMQSRNADVNLHTFLSYLLLAIALAMAGIAALWIYLLDRKEQAYLWLTLAFLTGSAAALAQFLGGVTFWLFSNMPALLSQDLAGQMLVPFFWLLFWAHWFRLRHLRLAVRAGWTLLLLEFCVYVFLRQILLGALIPPAWAHLVVVINIGLRAAFGLLLLAVTVGGIRQNRTEGWIALSAIVPLGIGLFSEDLQFVGIPVQYFPFGIHVGIDVVAWVVLAIIIIGLVLRRFLQTRVRQQELAQEMEQAHAVQSLLVPEHLPQMPGYRVEGTYLPASQVGGDFYQVLPLRDGGMIVVLGDVSGKGLRAAMVVSMAVGALRAIVKETTQPAEILLRLSRELAGNLKSGFVTCICVRLDADGTATVANAGHLPPWVNGKEVSMEGALPLGMLALAEYEPQSFHLDDGDTLVLMSDGIVEARSGKDGELYGFGRLTALLAARPTPAEIANVAQQFGQEDDISVLEISRVPVGEPAIVCSASY